MAQDAAALAAQFGGVPVAPEVANDSAAALAAQFGGVPEQAAEEVPAIVPMALKDAEAEVLRQARAGVPAGDIRAFTQTLRNPENPEVLYNFGPELESVVEQIQSGYQGPVNVVDTTQGDALGATVRGGLDAFTLNNADEIQAGLQAAFGDGTYDEYVRQARGQRTIDAAANPNERGLGEALGMLGSAALPAARILQAPTLGGRMVRGSLAGAAASGIGGVGASQDMEEAGNRLPVDLLYGATAGAAFPLAAAVPGAVASGVSSTRKALEALREAGISPAILRAEYDARKAATGRAPAIGELLETVTAARLRPSLQAAPEQIAAGAKRADEEVTNLLTGTRERASSVTAAQEAQDLAEGRIRQKVGDGDYVTSLKEELRTDLRAPLEGADARGPIALRDAQIRLDKENYGQLAGLQAVVGTKEVGKVNKFIARVGLDSEDAEEIRQRLNSGFITGDDYERIRRGLQDQVELGKLSKNKLRERVAELDAMFDEFLPEVGEARRASFAARSATEGSALGLSATAAAANKPFTSAERVAFTTPEQRAGVPSGAVQTVLNQTSSTDKATAFADRLANDPDYANVIQRLLPEGIGAELVDASRKGTRAIGEAESLGMAGVGGDPVKFREVVSKALNDPTFEKKLRAVAPKAVADDVMNYARVQRDVIGRMEELGLDRIAKEAGDSLRFAERVRLDPEYAEAVRQNLPAGVGDELIRYATSQVRAIKSLSALSGISPERVATATDDLGLMADLVAAGSGKAGAGFISGVLGHVAKALGIGQGPARKLAGMLFEPSQAENVLRKLKVDGAEWRLPERFKDDPKAQQTLKMLNTYAISPNKLKQVTKDALFIATTQLGKDNTRPPEGMIPVEQQ